MEKKCTICKEAKEVSDYHKDKSRHSGISAKCKQCTRNISKKHYDQNLESIKERTKKRNHKRYNENKEREKQRVVKYRKNNPDKAKEWSKVSYERNKEKVDFRINISMSGGIYKAIKEMKNGRHWESLVGYTLEQLMAHLESQFDETMSWDNYGSHWHIDHIKPKSWFLVETTEDEAFKKCWSLDNLQPLEASKNMSKRDRWEG